MVGVTLRGLASDRVRFRVGGARPDLGAGASLNGKRVFPADNAWNRDISNDPVRPQLREPHREHGARHTLHPDFGTVWNGAPNGIPYVVVSGSQTKVPIKFNAYGDESDPGPYPVPPNAPIEGGPNGKGDRHVIVIDRDNWKLYELYSAFPTSSGWDGGERRGLRPQLERAAGPPAGLRPTPRGCPSSPDSCATTRSSS